MPVVQCYARARVALRVGERSLTSTTTTTTTTTTTRRVGRKQPRGRGVRVRTQASLLGVGTPEVLVIGVVALLVFGPKVGNIFFFFQSFFFPQFLLMFTLFVFSSKKKNEKLKLKFQFFFLFLGTRRCCKGCGKDVAVVSADNSGAQGSFRGIQNNYRGRDWS